MKTYERTIETIKRRVEKDFPGDFALQQIHIARKLLSREAREKGLAYWEVIKLVAEKEKNKR